MSSYFSEKNSFGRAEFLALLLLSLGIFFRVFRAELTPESWMNFSPLMASALCGALFLPGLLGLVIPIVALVLSDALLNFHYGEPLISAQLLWTLPCYLITVGMGWSLRKREGGNNLLPVLGTTLGASILFYLVTNTGCWFGHAAYAQNFAGWLQSLTIGLPGYPPTWIFFRNSLLGDLLFAALFVAVENALAGKPSRVRIAA